MCLIDIFMKGCRFVDASVIPFLVSVVVKPWLKCSETF